MDPQDESAHPDHDDEGRPKRRGKASKRHTVGMVVLASALVLGLVTGLSVVYLYRHLNGNITVSDELDNVDNRPDKFYSGDGEPLNVLVLGSDTREGDNKIDSEAGGGVSDTTILLHLSGDRERAYGISIPRDSMVERPDCGPDDEIPGSDRAMWNVAYQLGGAGCTVEQFEQLTGVRVDDFVIVDFAGFQSMVDAIDGVPVCIPKTIDDREHGIYLEAGERELEGREALNYVRVRSNIGTGTDLGRIKRQQAFIAAMVNKVVSAGTLTRPDRVVGFLDAATESLTTSPGLNNLSTLGRLGYSLQSIGLDKVQFVTVPWEWDPLDGNRVIWNEAESKKLWKRIRLDKKLAPRLTKGAINAQKPPGSEAPSPDPSATPDDETPDESPSQDPSGTPDPAPTQKPEGPSQEEIDAAEEAGLCV